MKKAITLLWIVGCCSAAMAEETLLELSWSAPRTEVRLEGGEVVAADAETPFERLRAESSEAGGRTVALVVLDDPGVTTDRYALTGKVRYEGVEGTAYLEMWNVLANGQQFFSRTLAQAGPLRHLKGSSG